MDYGILLYEGAACSDFSCPLDIFHISNTLTGKGRVVTIARTLEAVRCSGGLTVTPDFTPQTAPPLDVLLVPGAEDPGQVFADNDPAFSWLQEQAGQVTFLASVCTGALIFQKARLLAGKKATTHWMLAEALSQDKEVTLLPEMRYVRDGNIVTS
jgi:transcriptional regulator GlxA family with amidase domain